MDMRLSLLILLIVWSVICYHAGAWVERRRAQVLLTLVYIRSATLGLLLSRTGGWTSITHREMQEARGVWDFDLSNDGCEHKLSESPDHTHILRARKTAS